MTGGITLAQGMTLINSAGNAVSFSAPTTNSSVTGLITTQTAGENLVYGNVCYINTDGKVYKADATTTGKFPAVYLATATIASGASGVFLVSGYARNDSWTWTVGTANPLWLSTAGAMTQTAPSSTGNCDQIIAFPQSATVILFDPSPDYITHT